MEPAPETTLPAPAEPGAPPGERPPLGERAPAGGTADPDEILDRFLAWVADVGFELYPAQEEALLELMAGKHVILNTPTGSGKSLVALGLHFKALCEGRRSFYTSPIKALASEKFFALCDDFGAENVGMLTGDASINPGASVLCCTAEVLMNMTLRQGERVGADAVVMDEFHYYADPERGVAWQVPLVELPGSVFLLMSATLGNPAPIAERLEARSGRAVAVVASKERPVPLDFEYRETPLHETVEALLTAGKAPIYIVNFTQRECAELAQSLTSVSPASREEREEIREILATVRFDTPYGREFRRFLSFGIGVHHAGLLPKYRLLVEQLAQQGKLKVISGTDTLGVGVNIPIRTVLFTKLSKYDGSKISILKVRDFQQIAGRAGRRGFDERGSVVAQAPEHLIEARRAKAEGKKRKGRKGPPPGFVSWSEETFQALIARPPETLKSHFRITQSMILNLLQRDAEADDPERDNFASLRSLIVHCHEDERSKRQLLAEAAVRVRSLYRAGIVRLERDTETPYLWVVVDDQLQWDFSLHQALSLFLVDALDRLDPAHPEYALDVVSFVEAILEDPVVILRHQVDVAKTELLGQLKAAGVPYEERMARLEEVTPPAPAIDRIEETFRDFRKLHPWVRGEDIRPKSIGREMFEHYLSFNDYVRRYGLQRSEGVLLRYLSQLYRTLSQNVPERAKSDEVWDILGFFRALVGRIDTSLLDEWESLLHPELQLARSEERERARQALWVYELLHDPRALAARLRAELHQLVRSLAAKEYEEAACCVHQDADDPWPPQRFAEALFPFFVEHQELVFDHRARQADKTQVKKVGERRWEVTQVLLDPAGDDDWYLAGEVDLNAPGSFEGPLVRLRYLGR